MSKQQTFAGLAWQNKGKKTRRERFLAEMDAIIPWRQLMELIEPHYPKAGNGRPPLGLEKMLRIYFLQIWFNLSDPGAEEAIYDSESMRRFAKIELSEDKVPDETSILNFRHLLEEHELTKAMFEKINDLLEEKGLLLRSGTRRRRDHHWRAEFDEERNREPRPGDEADQEGKELAFRNEGACGHRQAWRGAQPDGDPCGNRRHHAVGDAAAWAGADDLWRSGVLERS